MAIDATTSGGKNKRSRQYRWLVKQTKLFDELLTKQHQLLDQLLVKQHQLSLQLIEQCKLMFESMGAGVAPGAPAAPADETVNDLVDDLLAGDDELAAGGEGEEEEDLLAGKSPVQEKATPAAKPKPKPKQKDKDGLPAVPRKYWITLAALGSVFVLYLAGSYFGAPANESTLASRALSAGTKEDRLLAAEELLRRSPTETLPKIRSVATESKDPEVLVLVINRLKGLNDVSSLPAFLAAMKDENVQVREAGLKAALRVYGDEKLPLNVSYGVDDPPDQRELAVRKLLDHYTNPPRTPGY